jgi:hypothetical protein
MFREYVGRFPKDPAELTSWVRHFYRPPNRAPFTVLDALGTDLDCRLSPLGAPWDYDPLTGEIRLPAECVPEKLFRNRQAAFERRAPAYFGQ